jgi:hypothetical protein
MYTIEDVLNGKVDYALYREQEESNRDEPTIGYLLGTRKDKKVQA